MCGVVLRRARKFSFSAAAQNSGTRREPRASALSDRLSARSRVSPQSTELRPSNVTSTTPMSLQLRRAEYANQLRRIGPSNIGR